MDIENFSDPLHDFEGMMLGPFSMGMVQNFATHVDIMMHMLISMILLEKLMRHAIVTHHTPEVELGIISHV